mmetsp:Transcript_32626/g.52490  ORF Transcript_32626/g.52490 Transcript_32626/m.52490 type:complete len:219 (-) Transcript_32626:459-1115(-)
MFAPCMPRSHPPGGQVAARHATPRALGGRKTCPSAPTTARCGSLWVPRGGRGKPCEMAALCATTQMNAPSMSVDACLTGARARRYGRREPCSRGLPGATTICGGTWTILSGRLWASACRWKTCLQRSARPWARVSSSGETSGLRSTSKDARKSVRMRSIRMVPCTVWFTRVESTTSASACGRTRRPGTIAFTVLRKCEFRMNFQVRSRCGSLAGAIRS